MKVEIIQRSDHIELEKEINNILKYHHPSEILDIKYAGTGNHAPYSCDRYSAMIIYK